MKFRLDGTNSVLELVVGDVFDSRDALIIPTSVTFDTNTNDQSIHPNSIQGQFTKRFYSSDGHLDRDLQAKLQDERPIKTLTVDEKPFGKRKEYPVGTCVRVCVDGQAAYFLALTRYNRDKTSSATLADLTTALDSLWKHVRSRGELEHLVSPVIGSGRARVNETQENLIKETVRSFARANSDGPFATGLRIVIYPPDLERGNIDFESAARFIECQACYR